MTSASQPARNLRERHDVVQRMRAWLDASERQEEYDVDVLGQIFRVLPGVFSPHFSSETTFYAERLLESRAPDTPAEFDADVGVPQAALAL